MDCAPKWISAGDAVTGFLIFWGLFAVVWLLADLWERR